MTGEGFGRCMGCGANYLMNGDALYGFCHDPDCDGEVRQIAVAAGTSEGLSLEVDSVVFWASMIVQEGKPAALEIAERCGVEAALDAVNHIAEERQRQWKAAEDNAMFLSERLAKKRSENESLRILLSRWLEQCSAMGGGPLAALTQDTLDALGGVA